jgi:hypothetical protein
MDTPQNTDPTGTPIRSASRQQATNNLNQQQSQDPEQEQACHTSFPTSLAATTAALVSENVIDVPIEQLGIKDTSRSSASHPQTNSAEISQGLQSMEKPTSRRNTNRGHKGVNRHFLTPEDLSALMNNNNANYISQNAECTNETSEQSTSNASVGLVESTKRWLYRQQIKRQKQALEIAVEEQRRILLEEQKKNHTLQALAAQEWGDLTEKDLNHNVTFQSLTNANANTQNNRYVHQNLVGGLCGTSLGDAADQDEEYVVDVERSDDGARPEDDLEGYETAMQSQQNSLRSAGDEMMSCNANMSTEDEELFRIRSPSHTHTGGLAVHLEFMENSNKQAPRDLVKVFEEKNCNIPFILSLEQMTDIAESGLPSSIMFTKWKRLYSLQRDGDGFASSFLRKVKDQERTLLVIQTTNREVMGAFCNSPWECQGGSMRAAQFYGSAQACLFSIQQDTKEVLVYRWTGRNRYIQVCDIQQKMIALGGGGKDGAFGLCVEDDFRVGSTGPCETFNNPPLCGRDQFEIMNVECWGFVSGYC